MTTQEQIEFYRPQMESIAVHAKSINFNIDTDSLDDLMKSWIEMGRKIMIDIEENKNEVLILMKQLCQK